ncbi:MAG: hypothetical protein M3209_02325 [Acidobacteriota bacterium]|nr:hypothetical protein [Acidobacteriota bacterium]
MGEEIRSIKNVSEGKGNSNARRVAPAILRQFGDVTIEKFRVPAGDVHPCIRYPKHSIYILSSGGSFVHKHRSANGSNERTVILNDSIWIIPANLLHPGCSASGGEFFGIQFDQSVLARGQKI